MFKSLGRTGAGVLVAAVALLLGAFVAVPQADVSGGTINACVKNTNGAVHIPPTTATCKKGESPLSWSITGPQGPQGPPGESGSPGYVGRENGQVALEGETVVASKEIPSGSFLVSAKTQLFARGSTGTRAGAICELFDGTGELFKGPTTQLDLSYWTAQLAENESGKFEGASTLSLLGSVSGEATSTTISLVCRSSVHSSGLTVEVGRSLITAVRTSVNS